MSPAFDITTIVTAIIAAFAAYRITRFITIDELLGTYPEDEDDPTDRGTGLRRYLDIWAYDENGNDKGPVRGWFGKLLSCPWCAGVWVSGGCVWAAFYSTSEWITTSLLIAAVAGAQALLSSRMNA